MINTSYDSVERRAGRMALPIRTVRQSDQLQQEKNSDDAEKEKEKNIYY